MLPELEPKSVANEPKSHNQFKTSTTNLSYHQVYKCNVAAWKPGLSSSGEPQECRAPRGQPFLVFPEPLHHSFQCQSLLQFSKVTFHCQQADRKICLSLVTFPVEKFLTFVFVPL